MANRLLFLTPQADVIPRFDKAKLEPPYTLKENRPSAGDYVECPKSAQKLISRAVYLIASRGLQQSYKNVFLNYTIAKYKNLIFVFWCFFWSPTFVKKKKCLLFDDFFTTFLVNFRLSSDTIFGEFTKKVVKKGMLSSHSSPF